MKCPECGNECRKGVIEAKNAGSLTQSLTTLQWYPAFFKLRGTGGQMTLPVPQNSYFPGNFKCLGV